jgi:hypothetical protein
LRLKIKIRIKIKRSGKGEGANAYLYRLLPAEGGYALYEYVRIRQGVYEF